MKVLFDGQSRIQKFKLYIILTFIIITIVIAFTSMTYSIFASDSAIRQSSSTYFEDNENVIDIMYVLDRHTNSITRKLIFINEREFNFPIVRLENDELPHNVVNVIQEGRFGLEQVATKRTFSNDELVNEEFIISHILEAPVAEIIEVGTLSPPSIVVANAPNTTNTTTTPTETPIPAITNPSDSNRISLAFSRLSFGMDLSQPSGLSFQDFRRIIEGDRRDRYNVFADNIEVFYAVEQIYGINGIFVMALAIHESGWGRSDIARYKNNLFGYGAFDWDPFNSAWTFDSFAEGIASVSRALVRNYLHPQGTPIFYDRVASGRFYNGPTLSGVNVRYATDPNWAIGIFRLMEDLYQGLLL